MHRDNVEYEFETRLRAGPEEWLPLLLDVYECLSKLAIEMSVRPVVAGAAAFAFHVEADPTKNIDIVLSKPLEVGRLADLLNRLIQSLSERGWMIVGSRIQQGRSAEDWVVQVLVAVKPGRVVGVEVFNLLAMRPLSFYEVEEVIYQGRVFLVLTRESWVASKLADPSGVDERNLRRLEKMFEAGIDESRLFQILMKLSLNTIVQINAKDLLKRTRSEKLRRTLLMLV